MIKPASLALILALGAIAPAGAHAQLLDTGANGAIDIDVSGLPINVTATTSQSATLESGSDTETGVSTEATMDSGLMFSFDRDQMSSDTEYTVTESNEVRSSAGLESYAASTVRANERVESIALGEGRLEVRYRADSRFLWVIPASLDTRVTVGSDGTVEARYPWYAFLMSKEESADELASRIQSRIEAVARADADATATAGASGSSEIRRWARIMDRVFDELALSAETNADVQAEAGV